MKIDLDRWNKLSLIEQLANIGSEFMRWQVQKKPALKQAAQDRMLELLDLTIKSRPSEELKRLREIVCDPTHSAQIQKYLMEFALLARKS